MQAQVTPKKKGLTPEEFEALLRQTQEPDTEKIKQASRALSQAIKSTTALTPLLIVVQQSQFAPVRQGAAVLIKKKILAWWGKLDENKKNEVKNILLSRFQGEHEKNARASLASVIALIAKVTVPYGQWNELLQVMFASSQAPEPERRESSLLLFHQVIDVIAEQLKPQFSNIHQVLIKALNDPSDHVKSAALKAVSSFIGCLDRSEMAMLIELVQPMVVTIQRCLALHQDELAITAFDVFDDLLEIEKLPTECIKPLCQLMIEIGGNTQFDLHIRIKAMNFCVYVANYKPKQLVNNNFVVPILRVGFIMAATPEDPSEYMTSNSIQSFGIEIMEHMAISVSTKHVFPVVAENATKFSDSANPHERRAAYLALSAIASGCDKPFRDNCNTLVAFVEKGASDPEVNVRKAAASLIAYLAEYTQPTIFQSDKIARILPLLMRMMEDPDITTRDSALRALVSYIDGMESDDLLHFMDPLMEKLVALIQVAPTQKARELAVCSVASVAQAAGSRFVKYYQPMLAMLGVILTAQGGDELTQFKCRCIECVGIIAVAIERDLFLPYYKSFMELALSMMHINSAYEFEYREHAYLLFSNIASTMPDEFVEYLPRVMEELFKSIACKEGMIMHKTGKETEEDGEDIENEDEDEDEDALADDDGPKSNVVARFSIRAAWADEKSTACTTLGNLAQAYSTAKNPKAFLPFIEQSIQTLQTQLDKSHLEDVATASLVSFAKFAELINILFPPPGGPWKAGPPHDSPVSSNAEEFIDVVLPMVLEILEVDEKELVETALDAMQSLLYTFGPALLASHSLDILTRITQVLKKEAPCFALREEEDEDDHDAKLLDSTLDAYIALSKAMGTLFAPTFQEIAPFILRYYSPGLGSHVRSLVLGAIGGICQNIKEQTNPYLPQFIPLALGGLADPEASIIQNSIFCLGAFCEASKDKVVPHYPQFLSQLRPFFDHPVVLIKENAAGAVCRMITACPQAVPLPQVLPVLLSVLPVRVDFQEKTNIYGTLSNLLLHPTPEIVNFIPQIVGVFAEAVSIPTAPGLLSPEETAPIVASMKFLLSTNGPAMEQVFAALPEDKRNNLARVLA